MKKTTLCPLLLCVAMLVGCGQDSSSQSEGPSEDQSQDRPASTLSEASPAASVLTTANEPLPPATDYSNTELFIQDISEREFGKVNALTVMFSAPLDPNQPFQRFVQVSPSLPEPILSRDGRKLYFVGIEPETGYSIEVGEGIRAANGKKLDQSLSKTLQTRAMSPTVSFASEGSVMVPGHTEALPVMAVNVPEADLNVYRVKDGSAVEFFEYYGYSSSSYLEELLQHTYTSRIKINEAKNTRNQVLVNLKTLGGLKEPGIYFATIGKPGAFNPDARTWFTISAIGLQLRKFEDHTRLIAQDISSGALLPGINISVLGNDSKPLTEGQTNSKGSYIFRNEIFREGRRERPALIIASHNNQTTALPWHSPQFDLSDFPVSGRPALQEELYVYSPRNIYRPGETATFSILKRDQDGQQLGGPVKVEILKPGGSRFNNWLIDSPAAGYHELAFAIPANAPVGNWLARIKSPGNDEARAVFRFKVEEFLPERQRLTFNQGQPGLVSFTEDTPLEVNVLGEYLYGAPAAGNRLDTSVRLSPWSSPFEQLAGYIFGNPRQTSEFPGELESVKLNDEGITVTRLPDDFSLSDWQIPTRLHLQYSLYESGGRAVNRNYSALYWPRTTFIGVKPSFNNNRADSDASAGFQLLKANQQGEVQSTGEAKIELYREERKYFWTYTTARGWHYQIEENEYLAATRDVSFDSEQPVPLELPVEWGRYRLEVTDLQSSGKTTYAFTAGEDWYSAWNSSRNIIRPDRVNLALNQKAYTAGENARVRIAAPTDGKALVLLEADEVLHISEVDLVDRQAEVDIPIPKGIARHDLYVSAFVVAPTASTEKVAKRSFGIIPLPLDREDRRLQVAIAVPESWRPEQQVQADVAVLDAAGLPVNDDVYLTLSAVDSGILSVTGYQVDDPHSYFYSQRKYGAVLTDMFDEVLEYSLADVAKQRWGGDADLTRGGDRPKTEVQMVSLFSGLVPVTEGKTSIPLDLPQFEGELQLTAVGFGGDRFGLDEQTVKVTSPIVAQLSAPRFMAPGDQATLALDLVNMSGGEQDVKLSVSVAGSLSTNLQEQSYQLAHGQKEVVYFPVSAGNLAGQGTITAEISLPEETLVRHWTLGVRNAYPARYDISSTILTAGKSVSLKPEQLAGLIPGTVKSQLRVGKMPDLQASENWQYLSQYPYSCLEQTVSKTNPIAALGLSGQSPERYSNEDEDADFIDLNRRVQDALNRYGELQLASGGFGLWSRSASEEHWLTAYATESMLNLKKAGYPVSELILAPALKRLEQYVIRRSPLYVRRWSQSPSYYQLAYKSYAAYILAREGKIPLGPVRDIAERELTHAQSPLPGVHLGLAMIASGSQAEGEKVILEALAIQRKESMYLGEYGSVIRDQAMVINSLLKDSQGSKVMTEQALQLLLAMHNNLLQKKYLSTQERSALFSLALTIESLTSDSEWRGELLTNEQKLALEHLGDYVKNLRSSELTAPVQFTNQSEEPLFTSFAWTGIPNGYPESYPENVDNGIKVGINHYRLKDGLATPAESLSEVNVGEMVLSRVTVIADRRVPDALLVSLMPAGLELENQNLEHSLKLSDIRIDGREVRHDAHFEYQEFRDDRYVAALDLRENDEQVLYFVARAVNPGEYLSPPVLVESMYTPAVHGISNKPARIVVEQ